MNDSIEAKTEISKDVVVVREMIAELCLRLSAQPRSAVATRQLKYILSKMDQWLATFGPKPEADTSEPSRDEIDTVLSNYREKGFAGLSQRERFVIQWFDERYSPRRARSFPIEHADGYRRAA